VTVSQICCTHLLLSEDTTLAGAIGGRILSPGLYNWGSAVSIGSDITIAGGPTDSTFRTHFRAGDNKRRASTAWIFQVTGTLNMANAVKMTLTGGAVAANIVWVATGAITAGTTSHFEGVILGKTGITLQTGATANSRLLAQTAVALQQVCLFIDPDS
jgi:hypothetical protein